jgi:hypothetical protein
MEERKLLVKGTPPLPLGREFTVVGKSLNRSDGVRRLRGVPSMRETFGCRICFMERFSILPIPGPEF